MDSKLINLGTCSCGQCLSMDMMLSKTDLKCINCNNEYYVHIDLEPTFTLDEWEQIETVREEISAQELTELPF